MSDNENNFTHEGVEYMAVESLYACIHCDLKSINCDVDSIPSCMSYERKDGRSVIFKRKLKTKQQQFKKRAELVKTLLAGNDIKINGKVLVTNEYLVSCVVCSEDMVRLTRKSALGLSTDIEMRQLCELEALKIADDCVVEVLEMEKENETI